MSINISSDWRRASISILKIASFLLLILFSKIIYWTNISIRLFFAFDWVSMSILWIDVLFILFTVIATGSLLCLILLITIKLHWRKGSTSILTICIFLLLVLFCLIFYWSEVSNSFFFVFERVSISILCTLLILFSMITADICHILLCLALHWREISTAILSVCIFLLLLFVDWICLNRR